MSEVLCKEAVDFGCLEHFMIFERCLIEAIVRAANANGFIYTQSFEVRSECVAARIAVSSATV